MVRGVLLIYYLEVYMERVVVDFDKIFLIGMYEDRISLPTMLYIILVLKDGLGTIRIETKTPREVEFWKRFSEDFYTYLVKSTSEEE